METYAWKTKWETSQDMLISDVDFSIVDGNHYNSGHTNQYCISINGEDDPWHDEAIAVELGLTYNEYIEIVKKSNGVQYKNIIEYEVDNIHLHM